MIIDITPSLEDKIQAPLNQRYNAAYDFMESSYKKDAREWWRFYTGELPGLTHDAMVPAVDRTCYDIVENASKDLQEIFTSGENAVVFAPLNNQDSYSAKAATQVVNQIFLRDNNGKQLLTDGIRTALVEGSAIFKAWWADDDVSTHTVHEDNIPNEQEIIQYLEGLREAGLSFDDENAELIQNEDGTFNVTLTYTIKRQRVMVDLIPIEEFAIEPGAKSIFDADYMCHRVLKSKEQLKAIGLSDEELEEINTNDHDLSAWTINAARTNYRQNLDDDKGDDSNDPSFRVWIKEHYWRTGLISDDGTVRLYQIHQIQEGKIIRVTEVFNYPFVIFNPIPLPNNPFGISLVSTVADIQCDRAWAKQALHTYAQKSSIPNYYGVAGEYDERALMNPKPGTVFNVKEMGALQQVPQPAMPPLDAIFALSREEKEERTGINSSVAGLSADGIESNRSSEATVNNLITLATGRVRALGHALANAGYSELFRMIYNLYKDNSSRPIQVLTAYGMQPISPAQLVDRDHLVINVALTTAEKEKNNVKLNALVDFIAKVTAIQSPFIQTPQQAWLINEYGTSLGYPNVFDYSLPTEQVMQVLQNQQPDPMTVAQIENVQANTSHVEAQTQKLYGDDQHDTARLLFEQQLAAKQESRKDTELQFKMSNAVDELNFNTQELAVTAGTEAQKAQHNNRRQAVEEFKAKTANLKVNAEIIQKAQKPALTASNSIGV
jgi:hypothetical protein